MCGSDLLGEGVGSEDVLVFEAYEVVVGLFVSSFCVEADIDVIFEESRTYSGCFWRFGSGLHMDDG